MTPEVKERIEQIRHGIVPEGYRKTAHGIAPNEWMQKKLVEVVDFLDDQRIPIKENERQSGQYPYYGASGIIDYVEGYIFDGEYILLGEDGANILDRSSPLAFRVSGKCWINNHAHVLRPKLGYHINYLINYLESLSYVKYNSGSAQPKLNQDTCQKLPVVCGNYSEQEKIADILSTQDEVIRHKEKLLEEKQRQKKYLMQQLLTGKKRLPGFDYAWKKVTIGSFIHEVDEKTTENNQYDILSVTKNGIVLQSDHFNKQIASEDNTGYKILRRGNLAFSSMNLWMGSLDVLEDYEIGIISPAYKVFSFDTKLMDIKFGRQFMQSEPMIWQYKINSEQGASVVRRNLDLKALLSTKVSIPDLIEQKAIAAVFIAVDKEIELLRQSIEQEKQKKKALMQLLLTGIVRVAT